MKLKLLTLATFSLLALNAYADTKQTTNDIAVINQLMQTTVAPFMVAQQIPGIAIGVYYHDKAYFFNYGYADKNQRRPVTKDTIFELASITKIFTTTLLAYEVQAKKIQLSDPIIKYVPKLAKTRGLSIDNVKVVNLATHTASFPRGIQGFGVEKGDVNGLIENMKTWQAPQPAGTHYLYSNIGFGFLGVVLEGATGLTYTSLLNQVITQPLNMRHTYIDIPATQASVAATGYSAYNQIAPAYVPANLLGGGALRSSAADLITFMRANLGESVANASPKLLSAMQLAQQPIFTVRPNFVMGLGWQRITRNQQLFITKNGGNQGFSTFIGFSPDSKFGVVVLTNKAQGKAAKLGNQILNGLVSL